MYWLVCILSCLTRHQSWNSLDLSKSGSKCAMNYGEEVIRAAIGRDEKAVNDEEVKNEDKAYPECKYQLETRLTIRKMRHDGYGRYSYTNETLNIEEIIPLGELDFMGLLEVLKVMHDAIAVIPKSE